jgi:acylpyruvate hydrolase
MRVVVYGPAKRVGYWEGDQIVDLNWAAAKRLQERGNEPLPYDMATALVPASLRDFIAGGQRTLDEAQQAAEYVLGQAGDRQGPNGEQLIYSSGAVKLHPPIPNPGSPIAAMGANYIAHSSANRERFGDTRSDAEVLDELRREGLARGGLIGTARRPVGGFWKLTDTITGHDEAVIYPARTERFDYEGEVAIVIGKRAKHVPASKVSEYIWGTTIHVDWSIRDGDDNGNRTFRHAKNFDTSSSLGPSIVVGELDPQNTDVEVSVNGQARQHYNSSGMTFGFAEIIEFLSAQFTLFPGFILSGGSGPGTAMEAGSADRFLKIGDVVEFSSPRIGLMRSRIVKEEPVSA